MKEYTVVFTPEAEEQLAELYSYIAEHASADTALRYTTGIVDYCAAMKTFPHRGMRRDDIRPGLRITNYKRNAVIAFAVDDAALKVIIIGIFYGGRNYAVNLGNADEK
jgi:plasmid stabilization system protein ParE